MKLFRICLPALVLLSFVLSGCPVGSKYPLGLETDAVSFDKNLIGTWENSAKDVEAGKINIIKGSGKNTYLLSVLTKGDSFMADHDNFRCWVTLLNGRKFFVLNEVNDDFEATDSYFVYAFSVNGNQLTTNDISLKIKGTDAITSVTAYRDEVTASMKDPEFLQGKIEWKKQ